MGSDRWANLTGVRVARFAAMPYRQRAKALSDSETHRFALTRDPLERAESSYYSKIACGTGDAADHRGAIRQLLAQAPKAASVGLGPGSNLTQTTPCLSATDWGQLVLEARLDPKTRYQLNPHFMPQADACGLHTIGYHMLIPLEDHSYGMRAIAESLGVTATAPRLAKRHVVSTRDKRALSAQAVCACVWVVYGTCTCM